MTTDELRSVLKDSLGLELNPGAQALVFIDYRSVEREVFENLLSELDDPAPPVTFVLVHAPAGSRVVDCIVPVLVNKS